jgi:hypothetical protein
MWPVLDELRYRIARQHVQLICAQYPHYRRPRTRYHHLARMRCLGIVGFHLATAERRTKVWTAGGTDEQGLRLRATGFARVSGMPGDSPRGLNGAPLRTEDRSGLSPWSDDWPLRALAPPHIYFFPLPPAQRGQREKREVARAAFSGQSSLHRRGVGGGVCSEKWLGWL